MSWSITFIGKPENIIKALSNESAKMSGYSKTEYDAALRHLVGLVSQNFNKNTAPVLKISASGHGQENSYGYCVCSIESLGGTIV